MTEHPQPLDDLRRMYPAVCDPRAEGSQRRREVRRVQQLANILRQSGVPEEQNPASAYLRAAGIRRLAPRIEVLMKIGIPKEFLCSTDVLRVPEAARVLSLLVEHAGLHPDQITTADIEAFLARQRGDNTRGERPSARERHLLKRAFRLYYAFIGRTAPNPVITQVRQYRMDWSQWPAACREDAARLREYAAGRRFTDATQTGIFGQLNFFVRFLHEREPGVAERGVFAACSDPEIVLRFVRWRFEVPLGQLPRSVSGLSTMFHFVRSTLSASGAVETTVSDRMVDLKRKLRGGRDRGHYELALRSPDPDPAPSVKQVERARAYYLAEAARLREARKTGKLSRLLIERDLMETPIRTGMRLGSLVSCRADKITYDEATETLYVDEVIVKANRRRQRVLVPEKQVGNVTLSGWYLDPDLLELYEERFQLQGYSLLGYLETGDRRCLPWVRVLDDTFGPLARGQLVSPLWPGGRHGYMTKQTIEVRLATICRDRLGLTRGGGHPLRRRAALNFAPLAELYPQAVETTLRMGPAMWNRYRLSNERSPALVFPGRRPIADIIRRVPPTVLQVSVDEPFADAGSPAVTWPTQPHSRSRPRTRGAPRITTDDLLG